MPPAWLRHHHLPPLPASPLSSRLRLSLRLRCHSSTAPQPTLGRPRQTPLDLLQTLAMSAAAASLFASTSLSVPDHLRLHLRPPPSTPQLTRLRRRSLGRLVRAVLEDRAPPPAAGKDAKRNGLNGSGLGYEDAAVEAYLGSNGNGNGSESVIRGENGAAAKPTASAKESSTALTPVPLVEEETRRKNWVEEIGREDAWFKQSSGQGLVPEVSCASVV
jgi:hypothetical protein